MPQSSQTPIEPAQTLRQSIGSLGLANFCSLNQGGNSPSLLVYFVQSDALNQGYHPVDAFAPCDELAGLSNQQHAGVSALIRLDLMVLADGQQAQQILDDRRQALGNLPSIALADVAGAIKPIDELALPARGLIVADGGPLITLETQTVDQNGAVPFIRLTGLFA